MVNKGQQDVAKQEIYYRVNAKGYKSVLIKEHMWKFTSGKSYSLSLKKGWTDKDKGRFGRISGVIKNPTFGLALWYTHLIPEEAEAIGSS